MGGDRAAIGRAQRVGVAVVGGDDEEGVRARLAGDPESADDPPEAGIDRLDGADRGVPVARVADHVRVGVVGDRGRRTRPIRCPPRSASVTPGALISGWRSYVATFGLGTRIRSSFGNGASRPPFRKYVTCAYFSVSATWSCRQPASAIAPARHGTTSGGNATRTGRSASYSVIVTTSRSAGARPTVRRSPVERVELLVCQRVDELASPIRPEVGVDDGLAIGERAARRVVGRGR